MADYIPFLLGFVVALFVGIYVGRMLSASKFQSEKAISEERLNALNVQLQMLKEQYENEKNNFQKQLQLNIDEKENLSLIHI